MRYPETPAEIAADERRRRRELRKVSGGFLVPLPTPPRKVRGVYCRPTPSPDKGGEA